MYESFVIKGEWELEGGKEEKPYFQRLVHVMCSTVLCVFSTTSACLPSRKWTLICRLSPQFCKWLLLFDSRVKSLGFLWWWRSLELFFSYCAFFLLFFFLLFFGSESLKFFFWLKHAQIFSFFFPSTRIWCFGCFFVVGSQCASTTHTHTWTHQWRHTRTKQHHNRFTQKPYEPLYDWRFGHKPTLLQASNVFQKKEENLEKRRHLKMLEVPWKIALVSLVE